MRIPLKEFEEHIDEKILARGFSYFNGGAIAEFEEISSGRYEAIVSGSEDYTVQLKIKSHTIVEHNCDCPFDRGAVCKHVVAVIFHLQKDELQLNQPKPRAPKKKKTKTVSQQIKNLLKVIPHENLIEFVQENSKSDKKFRADFLASFGHLSQNQSKKFYQQQIHSILKTAAGRKGWIGWSDMKYVVGNTKPFLINANKYLENNKYENVFLISTALLEEMTAALQYGDDSDGDLGYFISSAFQLLHEVAQKDISAKLHVEMFDYCLKSYNKKLFEGWDWHLGMLEVASKIISEEQEADIILSCLNKVRGKFDREQAQSLKLDLLRRFKSKKLVDDFVNKNISNSSIRTKELTIAFESKNYNRVISLSKDGIKSDKKDSPGIINNWYNWLLKVAQVQKDTAKIIEYARYLFIDDFNPEQDYFQILKGIIKKKDWHPFLEEVIAEITPKSRWAYSELIRGIYINEKWWDRLFLKLQKDPSLQSIEHNEQYLCHDYAPELIELYSEQIIIYVKDFVGRKHYKTACRYLRRMKKLGGKDKVNELIEIFRQQYPRRPALMNELDRV